MYDFWSEADSGTRNWILKTVGANFAYGTILRDQVSGASWIYGANGYEDDLYRHWIPDGATYNCLVNNGAKVLNPFPSYHRGVARYGGQSCALRPTIANADTTTNSNGRTDGADSNSWLDATDANTDSDHCAGPAQPGGRLFQLWAVEPSWARHVPREPGQFPLYARWHSYADLQSAVWCRNT